MVAKKKKKSSHGIFIAAIGASAGGLEALQKLVSHIPRNIKDIAFIVVQHLSPNYKSMLVESLKGQTSLEVMEVKNGATIKERIIYITPPDKEISVKNGKFRLTRPPATHTSHPSINTLFTSLAADSKEKSIGIILSGTGTDGATGLKRIEEAGGIIIVQDPRSAKFNSMPMAAIDTTRVNSILTPDKIGEQLSAIIFKAGKNTVVTKQQPRQKMLEDIIELLAAEKGTDFTNYKRETLFRRINKRLADLKYTSISHYFKYLEKNPAEIEELFNTVLIGVTSFFRDPAVFKALEKYIGNLIDAKAGNETLRVWIPGCATGEEAYSIAMTIDAVLKKKSRNIPVQIFATDISVPALEKARKGVYPVKGLNQLPAEIIKSHFTSRNGTAEVNKAIRSMILFSKHDITHNPPFLKLDLIVCRNLLIYFNARLQEYVFPVFYSALNPNGYLLLGKSESIGRFNDLFTTTRRDSKIFQRKAGRSIHTIRYTPLKLKETYSQKSVKDISLSDMVKETIYKLYQHPYVVINDALDIQEISGDISLYLGLRQGQMNANLISMAHKDLKIELRSLINRCIKENREVTSERKKFVYDGKDHFVKIMVRPLLYSVNPNEFYLIIFETIKEKEGGVHPVSRPPGKRDQSVIKELEFELEAVKSDLQEIIERYENSNAQLQSINEELQSANEELKISNEELETANEELQSSNEEINIAYGELRNANETLERQEAALKQSEANIHALISNTLQAFILLDKHARVVAFNEVAVKTMKSIFGTRIQVEENFNLILSKSTFRKFAPDFKAAFAGKTIQTEYEITDPKGHPHSFVFSFTPVLDGYRKVESVSFSMLEISELKKTKMDLAHSLKLIDSVFHTADIGLAVVDEKGKFVKVNKGFTRLLGYGKDELTGKPYLKIIAQGQRTELKNATDKLGLNELRNSEHRVVNKEGDILDILINSNLFVDHSGKQYSVKTMRDITEERKFKELMYSAEKAMHIGSFEYNMITRRLEWTDEMYSIFDVGKDFIPNFKKITSLVNRKEISKLKKPYKELMHRGRLLDVEYGIITAQKKEKWVHTRISPVLLNKKVIGFRGTLQDITDRKFAEMEIERLSWVAMHTHNAVVISDSKNIIEWINDSFARLTGYSSREVKGKISIQLLQGVDTDRDDLKRVRNHLQKQQAVNETLKLYTKHGKALWLNVDVSPIFIEGELRNFIGIFTDLTELIKAKEIKRNQQSLEQRQRLLNAMAGNFPEGIIGVINRNLRYVFVGGTELKKLGHEIKDWIGQELFDKVSPEANQYAAPFLKKVFDGESVSFEVEANKNTYAVSAVPLLPEDDLTTRALVVIQNITERKKAEDETLRALMKQKELNELKSKFVTVASHEFRTPLGTILSSADLVNQYYQRGDNDNMQKHITRIKSSVNNLTGILNEFLSLSKIEEGVMRNAPEELGIKACCENLVEELRGLKKPGQQILYRHEGKTDIVKIDRQHIRNVLINILTNAIKYSPQDKNIYFTSVTEPGMLSFIVRDEGIGIADADKPQIFEAFFRAHNASNLQGTGLGLNIVKRYLKLMNGDITFDSELNKGSTFTVSIPQPG